MVRKQSERIYKMKKWISVLTALALILTLAACGGQASSPSGDHVEGSVESLLSQITEDATDPELELTVVKPTEDNCSWYFFIAPIEGAEAVVSEPFIGSIPHFAGLLRVPQGTDPEQVRSDIEEHLDPRKWVCVEAEKTAVLRRDDLILTVMSDADVVSKITANFAALGN